MFTGRALIAAFVCMAVSACASLEESPAFRIALDQCRNDQDRYSADVQIKACTEVLDSPARYTDDMHWLYADRARAYASRRDYTLALADYEKALFESPGNEALIFGRGVVQEKMGDRKAALASYDEAIQIQPRFDSLYYGRGRFLLAEGKRDLAIADFDEALRLDPTNLDARVARARAYVGKQVYGVAIKDLDIVLRQSPDDVEALWWRGRAYYGARDDASAAADFTTAMRLRPALTATGLNWRGRAYLRQKNVDGALADLDEAARIEPDRAIHASYQCYGRMVANRELDVGLAACRKALALDPTYSIATFVSGAIQLKQGDATAAEHEFDACAKSEAPKSAASEDAAGSAEDADWGSSGVCLYGRSLARLRLAGTDVAKRAEIAREMLVALAAAPEAAGIFASFGLEPDR